MANLARNVSDDVVEARLVAVGAIDALQQHNSIHACSNEDDNGNNLQSGVICVSPRCDGIGADPRKLVSNHCCVAVVPRQEQRWGVS